MKILDFYKNKILPFADLSIGDNDRIYANFLLIPEGGVYERTEDEVFCKVEKGGVVKKLELYLPTEEAYKFNGVKKEVAYFHPLCENYRRSVPEVVSTFLDICTHKTIIGTVSHMFRILQCISEDSVPSSLSHLITMEKEEAQKILNLFLELDPAIYDNILTSRVVDCMDKETNSQGRKLVVNLNILGELSKDDKGFFSHNFPTKKLKSKFTSLIRAMLLDPVESFANEVEGIDFITNQNGERVGFTVSLHEADYKCGLSLRAILLGFQPIFNTFFKIIGASEATRPRKFSFEKVEEKEWLRMAKRIPALDYNTGNIKTSKEEAAIPPWETTKPTEPEKKSGLSITRASYKEDSESHKKPEPEKVRKRVLFDEEEDKPTKKEDNNGGYVNKYLIDDEPKKQEALQPRRKSRSRNIDFSRRGGRSLFDDDDDRRPLSRGLSLTRRRERTLFD